MKLFLTFLLTVIWSTSFAQGFNKKLPVKINRIDIGLYSNIDFTQDFSAKKELVNNSGKLTLVQFTRAMTLANESSFPEGMNTPKKIIANEKEVMNYKAYWQGSWMQTNPTEGWALKLNLVWLPFEENQHMPDDLKPTDKDGIFLVVSNVGIFLDHFSKAPVPSVKFVSDMKKKHNKNEIFKIDSASEKVLASYGHHMEFAYKELVVDGKYSDQEFERISELAIYENWPKAFTTGKFDDAHDKAYSDMSKYKCYKITRLVDESAITDLVWIPKDDNKHMPPDMQPLTDEGFFAVIRIEIKEDPYLTYLLLGPTPAGRVGRNIAGKPRPNSSSSTVNIVGTIKKPSTPTIVATTTSEPQTTSSSQPSTSNSNNTTKSYTTSSGIQVTTGVDMSEFTNNSRLGTMMLLYGYNGKASTIYMYELRGKSLSDKQSVVDKLTAKISISTPFIGYQWLPGYDCNMAKGYVYKKTNSTNGTNCQGEFKIN